MNNLTAWVQQQIDDHPDDKGWCVVYRFDYGQIAYRCQDHSTGEKVAEALVFGTYEEAVAEAQRYEAKFPSLGMRARILQIVRRPPVEILSDLPVKPLCALAEVAE